MASLSTRATILLEAEGVPYEAMAYEVSETVGDGYGPAVAAALGLDSREVFKTLVAEADGGAVVALVPVSSRVAVKALARAVGAKRCSLVSTEIAERWTGYVVGGVSPFAQRRKMSFVADTSILRCDRVAVSGGRRGLQLLVRPSDLIELTGATTADITA